MWIIKEKTVNSKLQAFAIGIVIIILIPAGLNVLFGDFEQFKSLRHFIEKTAYGSTMGACFWLGNWFVGYLTGRKLNWRENPSKANLISLLSFITIGLIISLLIPFLFLRYVWHTPADVFVSTLVGHAFICISIDIIIISFFYSNYIVHYWGESIKNEEELKRENLIARYEALKNQVNPHFLFNTLNTLTGVVEQNPEKASEFIRKFSDIYRYVLEQKDKELIPLHEELKFVKDYIYLSKIRYGEGLKVENNIDNLSGMIIPLGLQMLIENAIKHNVISDDQPMCVEMYADNDFIYVKNTLQRKTSVEKTNKVGLDNLMKRYAYLSDKLVEIIETDTEFEVKLPLLQNKEL